MLKPELPWPSTDILHHHVSTQPPTPAPGIGDAGGVACVRLTRASTHSSACADLVLLPPPLHHSPHVTGLPGAVSSGQPDSDTESGNEKTGASSKTGGHRFSATPTTSAGSTSSTGSGNTTDPLGSIISQGASVAGVIGTAVGNVAGNVSTFVGGLPTYTSGERGDHRGVPGMDGAELTKITPFAAHRHSFAYCYKQQWLKCRGSPARGTPNGRYRQRVQCMHSGRAGHDPSLISRLALHPKTASPEASHHMSQPQRNEAAFLTQEHQSIRACHFAAFNLRLLAPSIPKTPQKRHTSP